MGRCTVQNTTKGRLLIVVLVLGSGLVGGALGAYFGRNELEIILLAVGFGFGAYLLLISVVLFIMYSALQLIDKANNDYGLRRLIDTHHS